MNVLNIHSKSLEGKTFRFSKNVYLRETFRRSMLVYSYCQPIRPQITKQFKQFMENICDWVNTITMYIHMKSNAVFPTGPLYEYCILHTTQETAIYSTDLLLCVGRISSISSNGPCTNVVHIRKQRQQLVVLYYHMNMTLSTLKIAL